MDKPEVFIQKKFGIPMDKFFDILSISQGAEGYILGSLGEQLFKKYAEDHGYDVYRIKEKPEGGNNAKADEARGDFYIRKKGSKAGIGYVVECKSAKSNAEDRGLVAKDVVDAKKRKKKCVDFLCKFSINRKKNIESNYKKGENAYKKKKEAWESKHPGKHFPPFKWDKNNRGH